MSTKQRIKAIKVLKDLLNTPAALQSNEFSATLMAKIELLIKGL